MKQKYEKEAISLILSKLRAEANSEFNQTLKMKPFAKRVHDFKSITIFANPHPCTPQKFDRALSAPSKLLKCKKAKRTKLR